MTLKMAEDIFPWTFMALLVFIFMPWCPLVILVLALLEVLRPGFSPWGRELMRKYRWKFWLLLIPTTCMGVGIMYGFFVAQAAGS